MIRDRLNGAKQATLIKFKACQLFLEDKDNIHLKDTYKIKIVHPITEEKDVFNKIIKITTYYQPIIRQRFEA